MSEFFNRRLFRINAITLICFSASVFAASPWYATDGQSVIVTTGYTSGEPGDCPLNASGEDSRLDVIPELAFITVSDDTDVVRATSGSTVNLDATTLNTSGNNAKGVNLDRSSLTFTSGRITTSGNDSSTIFATNFSNAQLNDVSLNVNTAGSGDGIVIRDSALLANGSRLGVSGVGSGLVMSGASTASLNSVSITVTNPGSYAGISLDGGNLQAHDLKIASAGKYGLYVGQHAGDMPEVKIDNSVLSVTEGIALGLMSGNVTLDQVKAETVGTGRDAHVLYADNDAHITIKGGDYSSHSANSDAVVIAGEQTSLTSQQSQFITYGSNSAALNISGGTSEFTDAAIETLGSASYGIHGKSGTLSAAAMKIVTLGEKSSGVVADSGSRISLNSDSTITTVGEYASGLFSSSGAVITADALTLATAGQRAHGLMSYGGDLSLTNSEIMAHGQDAAGIYAYGGTDTRKSQVKLDNAVLGASSGAAIEAHGATIDVIVTNGTQVSAGNGILVNSASYEDNLAFPGTVMHSYVNLVADGNITLNGTVQAAVDNLADLSLRNHSGFKGAAFNASQISVDPSSRWDISASSTVASLQNAGQVAFVPQDGVQSTLTLYSDYVGDNGTLVFNTKLGDDNSITNKMIVNGNTTGKTFVIVNNLGGQGHATRNGIELIRVDGESAGEFVQKERIVAGAYDYKLVRGQDGSHWYLKNNFLPDKPEPPTDPEKCVDNNGNACNLPPAMRPEAGSYLANLVAANNMFVTRLYERVGEANYTNILSGEPQATSLWLRQIGGHNRSRDSSGQIHTQGNRYVVQLGGDVAQWRRNDYDRWHLGIMAGYGRQYSHSVASSLGYNSKGSVEGYSFGGYGSWFANEENKTGPWVDSWVLYNWFNSRVEGDELAGEKYKTNGFNASLEVGYTAKLGEYTGGLGSINQWFIQPKAQIVWQDINADPHQEVNGSRIEGHSGNNLMTRLGVRTHLKGSHRKDERQDRLFEPFVEMNWIHNSKLPRITMDDTAIQAAGSRNLGEMKLGVDAMFNRSLAGWGHFSQQIGGAGYSDSQLILGVKLQF